MWLKLLCRVAVELLLRVASFRMEVLKGFLGH